MEQGDILLVEDDPNLGILLEESLGRHGFSVTLVPDGAKGLEAFIGGKFDLCLLDVMLPAMDGFSLAVEIRRRDAAVPMIFLTAKSLRDDRIEGLKLGADDYVTKPFSMEELVLRISAVLRRSGKGRGTGGMREMAIGAYVFDPMERTLSIGGDSRRLTGRETELLQFLAVRMNEVTPRSDALERIWGEDNFFSSRSMDVYISKLRKYLQADASVSISNIHGRGFSLTVRERRE